MFDAFRRARRVAGDAGVADDAEVHRPWGDGHEPGVLVPIGAGEDDGVGFRSGLALFQGDFDLGKFSRFLQSQKRVFSAADSTEPRIEAIFPPPPKV